MTSLSASRHEPQGWCSARSPDSTPAPRRDGGSRRSRTCSVAGGRGRLPQLGKTSAKHNNNKTACFIVAAIYQQSRDAVTASLQVCPAVGWNRRSQAWLVCRQVVDRNSAQAATTAAVTGRLAGSFCDHAAAPAPGRASRSLAAGGQAARRPRPRAGWQRLLNVTMPDSEM